jgi:hypothetical protein
MRAASVLRVEDAPPLGEVVLAQAPLPDVPPAQLAVAMADFLQESAPGTGSEALSMLRRMFPHSPLTLRVAALAAAMRR